MTKHFKATKRSMVYGCILTCTANPDIVKNGFVEAGISQKLQDLL